MNSKYKIFSILSLKNLILNSSMLIGLFFNLALTILIAGYLLIFEPDINPMNLIVFTGDNFFAVKIILLLIIIILFNGISLTMQDIMQDRDSKVSEIINTSIHEKHYIFGKIIASLGFMFAYIIEVIVSFIISFSIFSIFTKTDFNIYQSIMKPIFNWIINSDNLIIIFYILIVAVILMVSCLLLTLMLSVKVAKMAEAPSVALLVLLPYIIMALLIFIIPSNNMELWNQIINIGMFIPVVACLFIITSVLINGITLIHIIAVIISLVFLFLLAKGTINIYRYAFYLRANFKIKEMIKMVIGKGLYE